MTAQAGRAISEASVSEGVFVFLFHNLVAFARGVFNAITIEDSNVATVVINQSILPQAISRDANARPTHAQHARQEILSQRQPVSISPIMRHQKPARQPLVQS